MFLPHGTNVYLAAEIKKHVSTPVTAVGSIGELEMMEDILASGKADVIGLARALMADPNLPKKAASGKTEEIVPCLRCFDGCLGLAQDQQPWFCCVNPVLGYEDEARLLTRTPQRIKKVLIAGRWASRNAGGYHCLRAGASGHPV